MYKIISGILLFAIGWCYLYQAAWVARVYAWCRESVFNETAVVRTRRQIGLAFIVLSSFLFYSGFLGLSSNIKMGPRIEAQIFEEAQKAFSAKKYEGAIARCQAIIREKPERVDAWELLGSCWLAMGKTTEAKKAWERVLQLDPTNAIAHTNLISEKQPLQNNIEKE